MGEKRGVRGRKKRGGLCKERKVFCTRRDKLVSPTSRWMLRCEKKTPPVFDWDGFSSLVCGSLAVQKSDKNSQKQQRRFVWIKRIGLNLRGGRGFFEDFEHGEEPGFSAGGGF